MANQDFFMEIAMTKHPLSDQVKEVEPVERPDIKFKKVDAPYFDYLYPQKLTYEERLKDFREELGRQKEYYRPFMRDLTCFKDNTKKVMELKDFEFRYVDQDECFSDRNRSDAEWEKVKIPDYRGPADDKGRWTAYYRCMFKTERPDGQHRVILHFQSVDYKANIYVNGNYAGSHEGFFAPFDIDITKYLRDENELVIECHNDYTILGTGPILDGDKIYAATGPGWDDPYTGWHHCPAGAGIIGKVTVETRPVYYIDDIFVRPDIDKDIAEIRIGIMNYLPAYALDYTLSINLIPKNYEGEPIGNAEEKVYSIGVGKNEYRYWIRVKNYRLWEPDEPYLYAAIVQLKKDGRVVSEAIGTFGMKKFVCDESSSPKGKFYFNNRPFVLRGANEMGHLQQCVMNGDFEQLVDDILIAKICNINYYRITQRPVQEEIYDYMDMLGMMHQCDLPLFGFLRRNQFSEAIRQTVEMEHLVRRHVSTIMTTFINEPMCIRKTNDPDDKYSKRYNFKGHRHLFRDELEAFFVAARKAVYTENPDRVIKNVEGDYDPPTAEGMPDFHTYTMWYTNHGQPIGKLMKGYLPPVKGGWMVGCGEYGAEGLDNENIIRERYPKEWLATDSNGNWYPDRIVRAQTHSVHGDWYREQNNISDWVKASQNHQAIATKLMTDSFRRRGDIINQTAIHLLIDAWPSGWMKTLVCCDRVPKPAYFAYMDALEPVRVNLYTGRAYAYDDETVPVEAWLLNDSSEDVEGCIFIQVYSETGKPVVSCELDSQVPAANARFSGTAEISFRPVEKETDFTVEAVLLDKNRRMINGEYIRIKVYPRAYPKNYTVKAFDEKAERLLNELGIEPEGEEAQCGVFADISSKQDLKSFLGKVREGMKGILVFPNAKTDLPELNVSTKPCGGVFYASGKDSYEDYHFYMLYNGDKDYIDFAGEYTIETDLPGEDLVYTYSKSGFDGAEGAKKHLPFVKKVRYGNGDLYLISLCLEGRLKFNPNLDKFMLDLIGN